MSHIQVSQARDSGRPLNAVSHRTVVGRPLSFCEIGKAILSSALSSVEKGK